ncbi:MAG: beta-N-acetylglucosaminidase domain-containing protein [Verrucomicrobiales bacterium]|nr:beta-N-acetylglucosaminidase domain-containing protein [Verrucomicrobiales bacterium]
MQPTEFLSGVIEGFYGRPWSAAQRRTLFQWLRAAGLNTYMYAPKDDLKHRALWREPYDARETAELGALIRDCRAHGLHFVYAVAPGLDVRFTDPADRMALLDKIRSVRALGADGIAVLFDDIPAALNAADSARFGDAASAQSWLANEVLADLEHAGDPVRLLFCPTAYCGRMAQPAVPENAYLGRLGEALAPEIDVFWTGPHIVSERIPVESLRELARVVRRRPVLWDNLFANDYDMRRLYLGPFDGREAGVAGEVGGILLNPNCPFEANFVGIHTTGAYLADPTDYRPAVAYEQALAAWRPSFQPAVGEAFTADELRLLADLLHLPTTFGTGGRQFLTDLDHLRLTPVEAWDGADRRLASACETLEVVYDKLTRLADRSLMHALYLHAWELKELGQFLRAWIEWRREHPGPEARFASPDFRPGICRGSLGALLESRFPVQPDGSFAIADGSDGNRVRTAGLDGRQ